jgi:phosphinothricin acetyltransferase
MVGRLAPTESFRARLAVPADAPAIARIYNEAIAERTAMFETAEHSAEDVLPWLDGLHPLVVVTSDTVVAFAASWEYRPGEHYRGVFELGVYTERQHRRGGAGALAMRTLVTAAREAGAWKLVARVFVENAAVRALLEKLGFREVGTYGRHGKLDGRWKDVVIVEKFLAPIGAVSAVGPSRGYERDEVLTALRSSSPDAIGEALDWARFAVERDAMVDLEVRDAAMLAFFGPSAHGAAVRTRFVAFCRACAAVGRDAARDMFAALFDHLASLPLETELDAFYEAAFVIKQIALGAGVDLREELAPQVPRLVEWLTRSSELPSAMRTRISPGNVSALLLTLADAGAQSAEERQRVADLAWRAKARHGIEPPIAIRTSVAPGAAAVSKVPPPPPAASPEEPTEPPEPKKKRKAKRTTAKPKRAKKTS